MRPAFRVTLVLLVALALGAPGLLGCARDPAPQLIDALDVAPREIEAGDRLEVIGASFPQGKRAHVTFKGTLHRPAEKPHDAEIVAQGDAASATQIEIDFTEGLEELFCGAGEAGTHTTFEGDVEVAFPAATPGAPPIAATVHAITLDVRPPAPRRAIGDARTREGERALAYYGIHPAKNAPAAGGVLVEQVDPDSRAATAGIVANDVLVAFDGVRISTAADVIPAPSRNVVAVSLRRGSSSTETPHELKVDGFKASPPADLYGAALLLAIAAAVILFFMAPTAGLLTWMERRVAARMRPRAGTGTATDAKGAPPEGLFASVTAGFRAALAEDQTPRGDRAIFRLAPYLVFVGVSAAFVVMPFGQYLIAADLDVGILYVLAVTSLVTIGLLSGGWAAKSAYSLLGGIRAAAQVVSYQVPGAIAVACIVLMTGSLRMQEIIRAQGGWPWEWFLFKNPVTFGLFFVYLTTALAGGNRAPFDLPEAESDRAQGFAAAHAAEYRGVRHLFFFLAEWANVFVMSGVAAALFLGGWQVPGLGAGQQEAHVALQALGAVGFLLKAWALIFVVVWIRWALPRVRVDQMVTLCWKWLVPLAFAAFALCAGWVAWNPTRATQTWLGVGMFAIASVGLARFVQRVAFNLRRTGASGELRLNPFL